MTYVELNALIKDFSTKKQEEIRQHANLIDNLDNKINRLVKIRGLVEAGLSIDDAEVGVDYIKITNISKERVTPEVIRCFDDAVGDVRDSLTWLKQGYFGVKSYAGWASQKCDLLYGMGPAHGTIWFKLGIKRGKLVDVQDDDIIEPILPRMVRYLQFMRKQLEGGDE